MARAQNTIRFGSIAVILGTAAVLAACTSSEPDPTSGRADLPYADEFPAVGYARNEPRGALGRLASSLSDGETELRFDQDRGYLDAALDRLGIDPSTQVLVFSRTSLQARYIDAGSPRAIYFNDETFVAWEADAPALELAGYDPALGPVFYRLPQTAATGGTPERQFSTCLRCHDTYSLSGGGVPRFLLGSGYTGPDGELVSHEAWILTSQATPLRSRWGGWYVTGQHGDQAHLGNIVVERIEDLQDLESLRVGNIDDVEGLFDTSRYLTSRSDIVALMVLEHQVEVLNLLSRLRFEAERAGGAALEPHVNALLRAMFMIDAIELTDPIAGNSGFTSYFESLGPFDASGRSLRELDLGTRLFRYPLSYLIYSDAVEALPANARAALSAGLRSVLDGSVAQDGFDRLTGADRNAIREILVDTAPGLLDP